MPRSTANASVKPNAGSETRRWSGILMGWPVVAGIPRWYILRPQRDPDAREALDRPMAVRLAQRMLAVPGLLEQGRQGLRGFAGDMEPLDREDLELPRGEGVLGGDPPRAEQRAEPPETREDHGPDVSADFESLDRVLHRVGRGVPGRGIVRQGLRFDLDDPGAAAEQDDQDDDRHQDGQSEEQAERCTGGDRPSRPARGPPAGTRAPGGGEVRESQGGRGGRMTPKKETKRTPPLLLPRPGGGHGRGRAASQTSVSPTPGGSREITPPRTARRTAPAVSG